MATTDKQPNGVSEKLNHTNRLGLEKSPYLLQHAHNPVDWYPWGEEAFDKAEKEDKPIFLSIGYSTCHWCHVMEKESFEDENTARMMNETFVSIKVDREERPDIDNVYMTVCQMMTGGGGWPLNIIMTPDRKPFFAGTYFPRESMPGRIGMLDLSARVRELWRNNRANLEESADKVTQALRQASDSPVGQALGEDVLHTAYTQLTQRFDHQYGGFSDSPKFPTPHNLMFLLRYWKRSRDPRALEMVETTLKSMRAGGVYDHIGFGFHRYSTDKEWLVPHFEKMLYDQALIAMAYTEAYQAVGNPDYKNTAEEVFEYVLRDMTSPEGGFYSAEDADSEGEEGKFYVWSVDEIQALLDQENADLFICAYNLSRGGNFKNESTGSLTGMNIPHLTRTHKQHSVIKGIPLEELEAGLSESRKVLFHEREKRIHPHKDDKILADWNGLMIAALAKGSQAFDRKDYLQAAQRCADFIVREMGNDSGELLHRYRDGQAGLPAHVDDYAFLIWGLIELYEASFDFKYLSTAIGLNHEFIARFRDEQNGGFFFTGHDSENLPVRNKEIYDGATPSGNSAAALNMIRLSRITGDSSLEKIAIEIGKAFSDTVRKFPSAYTQLLNSLDFVLGPSFEVVVVGNRDSQDTLEMLKGIRAVFEPNKTVILKPLDETVPQIVQTAPFTAALSALNGKATVYVCRNYNCELPSTDPDDLTALMARPA
jgi:uncharacterized protein